MEPILKNKALIATVLIILILVIIRSAGSYHFKNDARKWAETSMNQSNTITEEKAGNLSGQKLIIFLVTDQGEISKVSSDTLYITADSVLSNKYLKTIIKHSGPVMITSAETAVSARIWMVLSQMGRRNLYILTNNTDNEILKYKFRPDTLLP
jgi:hypothetical protein